ncbi:DnaJ-domain-containing protein [Cristinia sonorae]|uniref:DnaJ-domain-containing protein n=1 Tax=Cristinia sonorae TaxID=1940300 RepID=A0A8K0UNW9_9AGAR|nr:DnaJ-domain-containing protein [Cristinia sonorae]
MAAFTFLFLSVFLFALLVNAADLYKVLDIDRAASEKDIRAAYKRLSRKYHPDKNKEEGAEEKFVEVAHAYEVLSDPQKRQIYDRHGEEGLKMHEGGGQHHANPFDMFQNFFGGGHPGGAQTRKGPTSLLEMEINLADMYTGASIDFSVKKRILCDHCRGSGAASSSDIHTCTGCNGQGVKIMRQQIFPGMFSQSQVTCNECGGRGKVIKRQCPHCQGAKVLDHTQRLTLEVPRGSPEGHEIVFEGEADENPDWEAGDILIRVKSKTVKGGFRRKESGLYWKETISVDEALLGFERNITHLDGHTVELKRNSVTQPGFVQTIKGEGMPIYEGTGYGDLYVEYNVILPNKLSPQLRKQLTDVFRGDKSGKAGKDEL